MNFVHGVFYKAIFSNMAKRQRARYRVARYVIVNNVTTATLESKMKNENAWKRRWQKRNGNSLNSLYLGVPDSFKDGSSKLNNHSAMVVGSVVSLFLRFLFSLNFVLFYGCFPLHFRMVGYARHTMCTSVFRFFIHISRKRKKSTINS